MNGEPVTRLRSGPPAGVDRYGAPVPGVDVETPLPPALFAPVGSIETVTPGRALVVTQDSLYWRRSVDVGAGDRVRVRGVVYAVDGDPAVWRRGDVVTGVVARLKHA